MKKLVVDLGKCNGCFNCQLACKDEHCGNDWRPIAASQPMTGQFWCRVEQKERGRVPVVRVAYHPTFCGHCEQCPLLEVAPDAVYRRQDGLVIIDPEKAQGRRDLADACPLGMVYYDADQDLPQKCTGCAHLLDEGWKEPRCVDACATGALAIVDCEEVGEDSERCDGRLDGLGSRVVYRNIPKRWIAGTVADRVDNEVVIGANVTIMAPDGSIAAHVQTDEFGDFRYEGCEETEYRVRIECPGYDAIDLIADCREADVVFDDIFVRS